MGQLPEQVVRAHLAEEIPAAFAWASRRGLDLGYDEAALTIRLPLEGPPAAEDGDREAYLLAGVLDDYAVLPPDWHFLDPRNAADVGKAGYPQPNGSSIFHTNGCICAPWSRRAYAVLGGPHGDWGELTDWKTPRPPHTHAVTIADMLDRVVRELASTRGRMEGLPQLP